MVDQGCSRPNPPSRTFLRFVLTIGALLALMAITGSAEASHLLGGGLDANIVGTYDLVRGQPAGWVVEAQGELIVTRSLLGGPASEFHCPTILTIPSGAIDVCFQVVQTNDNDWLKGRLVCQDPAECLGYPTPHWRVPFTEAGNTHQVEFGVSAWTSGKQHINNPGEWLTMHATYTLPTLREFLDNDPANRSPFTTTPADEDLVWVTVCERNSICTIKIPAADRDNGALQARWATGLEACGGCSWNPLPSAPSLTMTASGASITWNTNNLATAGDCKSNYSGSVVIDDGLATAHRSWLATICDPPTLDVSAQAEDICTGANVMFTAKPQGHRIRQITWSWGDGTPDDGPMDLVGGRTQEHAFAKTGTYNVTVTIEDYYGRFATGHVEVEIGCTRIEFGDVATDNIFVCKGVSTSFRDQSFLAAGATTTWTFWGPDGLNTTSGSHPMTLTRTFEQTGIYTINLGVANDEVTEVASLKIEVVHCPKAFAITGGGTNMCVLHADEPAFSEGYGELDCESWHHPEEEEDYSSAYEGFFERHEGGSWQPPWQLRDVWGSKLHGYCGNLATSDQFLCRGMLHNLFPALEPLDGNLIRGTGHGNFGCILYTYPGAADNTLLCQSGDESSGADFSASGNITDVFTWHQGTCWVTSGDIKCRGPWGSGLGYYMKYLGQDAAELEGVYSQDGKSWWGSLCMRTDAGEVWCNEEPMSADEPWISIAPDLRFAEIYSSLYVDHMCGLTFDGQVYCWDESWCVGLGGPYCSERADQGPGKGVIVDTKGNAVQVAVSYDVTCILRQNRTIDCHGLEENWRFDGVMLEYPFDHDDDRVRDWVDNCPRDFNPTQVRTHKYDWYENGDACWFADDLDNIPRSDDNCPLIANPGQQNTYTELNRDQYYAYYDGPLLSYMVEPGDHCGDYDRDEIIDLYDNCGTIANKDQGDWDADGVGDACDDSDGDDVLDIADNCRTVPNKNQKDSDDDGVGDACPP